MTDVVQLALKFMLCTLARGVEVREMRWAEVNLKDKVWIIPSENAKNRREHLVPLNRHALAILSEVWEITGHSDYVFGYNPAMNSDSLKKYHELKPMGVTALSHAMRDNFHLFGIEKKFTPHNLRRTGATRLTSSGYSKEWVKKLLNHADQDVTDIYDVYDYFEEKRAGTELIGYLLDRILSNEEPIQVPSVKTLRREVLTKGLVYKFMSDEYYEKETNANIPMGFQATFSSPVSYMLSYAHDELKKSA
ncbi:MAG: site-specific integrase [Desulfovibrionales bacterium]|nr:site-specific integrase [Desulfovibrionales bacterium]